MEKIPDCPQCGQGCIPYRYAKCHMCNHVFNETYVRKEKSWEDIEKNRMGLNDFKGL